MMFHTGFVKVSGTIKSNISPEEYYDLKGEKDPYAGAVLGAIVGSGYGGAKHRSHKAALRGAAAGGLAGAGVGYVSGKLGKAIRLRLLKNEIEQLNLKASPGHSGYGHDS